MMMAGQACRQPQCTEPSPSAVLCAGDYPESLKTCAGANLPKFTPEESQLVKGSTDFLGINFYTGK